MIIAIILGLLCTKGAELRSKLIGYRRGFYRICVAIIVFHLLLFFYIPVRIEYLLPVILALAGVFLVCTVPQYLMIALIVVEGSYWFISIELLEVQHTTEAPCAPVQAVAAHFSPHVSQGVLVGELSGKTDELECLPQLLLKQPANIRDKLPVPASSMGF